MKRFTRSLLPACLLLSASVSMSAAELTGKQLFVRHCARCHTTAGSGLPEGHPLLDGFVAPPADFTDPLFNSMEPAADWYLVVKHGGASMGLSDQMPAHAERLSDAQIEAVVEHLSTFADTTGYPSGDLNFVRAQRTIKAFPETELLLLGRYAAQLDGEEAWKSTLYHGRRLGKRWQVEAKLSHLSHAGESEGELEVGVKWAAFDRGSSFLLSVGAEAEIPFEDTDDTVLIPYLSHASPLGDSFTLQGTLRAHMPTQEFSHGDLELSEIIHWLPRPWPRGIFPGLEAVLAAPFDSDGEWEASIIPQLHIAMTKRGHVAFNVGVQIPLTDQSYDYRLLGFLLWDMADGGFWEGW